jgi:heme A synthase
MANAPLRPPWFGNIGVQVLAGIAVVYNLVQLVIKVADGHYGDAFLSFAWTVLFGYVLLESVRARKEQAAADADGGGDPAD